MKKTRDVARVTEAQVAPKPRYNPREDLCDLMRLLGDRIRAYHEVKDKQDERHAFILYRNMVMDIWSKCRGRNGDNA